MLKLILIEQGLVFDSRTLDCISLSELLVKPSMNRPVRTRIAGWRGRVKDPPLPDGVFAIRFTQPCLFGPLPQLHRSTYPRRQRHKEAESSMDHC